MGELVVSIDRTTAIASSSAEYGYHATTESTNCPKVLAGFPCQLVPWPVLASKTALTR